jgi:hypothetical protein
METKTMFATPRFCIGALALVLAATTVTGAAQAAPAGKLLPGTQHTPPRFVDETSLGVSLSRNRDGYKFNVGTTIAGATNERDRVRLDWKQGGKLLASAKCELSLHGGQTANVTCVYQDKPLTAKGAIEADLIYTDDTDDNEYLLRTFKITVAKYPTFGDPVWQVVPDDVLGAAWVAHWYSAQVDDERNRRPHFYFWVAGQAPTKMSLRCTVDGTKIPDIELSASDDSRIEATTQPRTGTPIHYEWSQVDATAYIYFGQRAGFGGVAHDGDVFLGDHPGAWVCLVRHEGDPVRELAFTVTDKGLITSELQTAKGAPMTFDGIAAVELRFPKGAKLAGRIRPEAMKKSRGFGLPWPEAASVKAIQATFPAASGWPDPK